MKIINLESCRELLDAWAQVRAGIIRGEYQGILFAGLDREGFDRVITAGTYSANPSEAAMAAIRLSWELTKP